MGIENIEKLINPANPYTQVGSGSYNLSELEDNSTQTTTGLGVISEDKASFVI